jgi:hypothetical protein
MDKEVAKGEVVVSEDFTAVTFRDSEGNPMETLAIQFDRKDAGKFVRLLLSMQRAAHNQSKMTGVSVDRHVMLTLEALAETVQMAFDTKPEDEPVDLLGDVVAFHERFNLEYHGKPRSLRGVMDDVGADLFDFRLMFDREETDEYEDEQEALSLAISSKSEDEITLRLHKQLDALLDGIYVKLGTAYLQFGPSIIKEGWRRVQRANMAKIRATHPSQSKRGSTFDVIKPEGWAEPDHRDLVEDHAHRVFRLAGKLNPGHEHDTQAVRPSEADSVVDFIGTNQ